MKTFYCFLTLSLCAIIRVSALSAQTVQMQLDSGIHPCTITDNGIPVDSVLGKMYGGGFIFYFDPINCEGLVAAPSSQDIASIWGCFLTDLGSVPNVEGNATIPSGPGAELFDGKSNTMGILNDCLEADIAALSVSVYSGGDFMDWYLPSILELAEMHEVIGQGADNVASFIDAFYWSSTEEGTGSSWIVNFSQTTTNFALTTKFMNLRVRAIRKIEPPELPITIHVDITATGNNTGENWTDAIKTIEDAIAIASACDTILVAEGTYLPDVTGLLDARTATFTIPNSVHMFGGFPNGGGQRNIDNNPTILSGAIDIDPTKYVYHVLTMENLSNKTYVDGFTITNGRADGVQDNQDKGGGIYHRANNGAQPSSPTITNCRFINNISKRGGAIYNVVSDAHSSSSITISKSLFQSNEALFSNGEGGALCNDAIGGLCLMTIDSCQFINNQVFKSGGAIHNHANNGGEVSFSITNSEFYDNVAQTSDGGAISIIHVIGQTTGTFDNCQFMNNTSNLGGGGISTGIGADGEFMNLSLTNCLFEDNLVLDGDGGAIGIFTYEGGQSNIDVTHTIFKNNKSLIGGGALALLANASIAECNANITNCIFEGNRAEFGGGVSVFADEATIRPKIIQCLFFRDTARFSGAIDLYTETGLVSPEIINCTIARNTTTEGSAVTAEVDANGEVSPLILNTIIWENEDFLNQSGFNSINATPTIDFSLVDTTTCLGLGDNAICGDDIIYNIDPNFIDIETNDFHFNGGSIAVNAGQNDSLSVNNVSLDLDGETRIKSDIVDLGVFEFEPCPNDISLLNKSQTAGLFHAITSVESNGFLKPSNNGGYKAGMTIDLLPEFTVELGAAFEVSIEQCISE